VRLFVFDLDGTLIDSRRDLADSANELLGQFGAAALPEDQVGQMVGDGAAVLVARVFASRGVEPPPDALGRFLAIYGRRLLVHTRPYPGIGEVLAALASRAALAVLTNKPLAATRRILTGLDLARYFSESGVIGGDGPFPRKPDPAGLRHLATLAGVSPASTLLIGDSVIDWETARRATVSMCLARYGFGGKGFPVGALGPSDRLIDSPVELLAL
jgi:phosphoglycolate phosphatase